MAEIINLRTARKQAARAADRQTGAENAARHGRSLGEKTRERAEAERAVTHLDGHRRETAGETDEESDDGPDQAARPK